MALDRSLKPWVVCQIGAREHYAVARALKRSGVPVTLATDYWHYSRSTRLIRRLAQRCHDDIDPASVVSFNSSLFLFEIRCRLSRLSGTTRHLAHGTWFGKKVASELDRIVERQACRPVVFSYSYAACEIFKRAKSLGCKTVLGQIDPGPEEERLVRSLYSETDAMKIPVAPAAYWDNWEKECELADSIIVNSEWSRSLLVKHGVSSEKIESIPLAYEAPGEQAIRKSYPKAFSPSRPLKILFLGQIGLRKGIREICYAAELLAESPVHWTIVGSGDAFWTKKLQSLPNATVTGSVSRREVKRFYQEADVFILPTHSDGYAITQLEAASFGLPIIASRNCGEVVEDEMNGLLLPQVDSNAIVEAVTKLLTAPDLLGRMNEVQLNRKFMSLPMLGNRLSQSIASKFC